MNLLSEKTRSNRLTGPEIPESSGWPEWLRETVRQVDSIRYGQVTLTIHQGEVIEIQKTERTRLSHRKKAQ